MVNDIYRLRSKSTSAIGSFFGPLSTGVSEFDLNMAAIDAVPVQRFDCLIRFAIARHLDETESLWFAGKPVFYYFNVLNIPKSGKYRLQTIFSGAE
jgi:hypothetical protein